MSKVANYLQSHILGEVTIAKDIRRAAGRDASVLEITPEMVVYPRVTEDIRKVARFSWQLAEKGHVLPITPRGGGTDQTGAAIGPGIALILPAHMNKIYEFEAKQRLVRVQPGVNFSALQDSLNLAGACIPSEPKSSGYSTIGGAVANNAGGPLSGKYGSIDSYVHQLEVVLANGDIIQTGKISKRDFRKKKEQTDFEGEIYKGIDQLLSDNADLIQSELADGTFGNTGYAGIAEVLNRDGSIDLTPLFVGSQGTLGIISEMIMKCDFSTDGTSMAALLYQSKESARDAMDAIKALEPSVLEYFDAKIFDAAAERGRVYEAYKSALENGDVEAVLIVVFDDFNERQRKKKLSKLQKVLASDGLTIVTNDDIEDEEFESMRQVTHYTIWSDDGDVIMPPLMDGFYIDPARFDDFVSEINLTAAKHRVHLPIFGRALDSVYSLRADLSMHRVTDKQKYFQLVDEITALIRSHGGYPLVESAEGRVKSASVYKGVNPAVIELFAAIKNLFDPYGILNPGVKQPLEVKQISSNITSAYDIGVESQASIYY